MQNQIEEARVNLEQAEIDADVQYDSMKLRIQFMYERNEDTYLDIFAVLHRVLRICLK